MYQPHVIDSMEIKRNSIILLVFAILALNPGCNKDNRTELFELNHIVDFVIPPGLNTFDTHFFIIPQVNSQVDDQLQATGLSPEVIASIEPKFCRLSTIFEDEDLDFIRVVEVRVIDPFNSDFQREVFYLDPVVPNTKKVIRPFPGLADVKEILSKPSFAVEIRLLFRNPPPASFEMRLSMELAAFQ